MDTYDPQAGNGAQQTGPAATDRDALHQLSHDLRTPLNAIIGLSQILNKSQPLTPKQQEMTNILLASAKSLLAMIDNVVGSNEAADKPASPAAQSVENLSILLAEDHAANILIATTLLESLGYRCDVAKNGREVLDKLAAGSHYDAVLMDVQMPGLDGYTTTRMLREEEQKSGGKHMPIIGVTAHVLKDNIEKCYESGMDDYIGKPFTAEELKSKLASLITSR